MDPLNIHNKDSSVLVDSRIHGIHTNFHAHGALLTIHSALYADSMLVSPGGSQDCTPVEECS
jgi:hypothetical protein